MVQYNVFQRECPLAERCRLSRTKLVGQVHFFFRLDAFEIPITQLEYLVAGYRLNGFTTGKHLFWGKLLGISIGGFWDSKRVRAVRRRGVARCYPSAKYPRTRERPTYQLPIPVTTGTSITLYPPGTWIREPDILPLQTQRWKRIVP